MTFCYPSRALSLCKACQASTQGSCPDTPKPGVAMFLLDSHIKVYNFRYLEMNSHVNTKCKDTLSKHHFCLSRSEYQV